MNMTKRELVFLFNNLTAMKEYSGFDFRYMVASNLNMLKDEFEAIKEANQPSKRVVEFVEKRNQLFIEFAEKDKSGNPVTEMQGKYEIVVPDKDRAVERIEAIEDLSAEYKEDVAKEDARLKEVDEKLNSETFECELQTIAKEALPDDIGVDHMTAVFPLIVAAEL